MTPVLFWGLTPWEFNCVCRGYSKQIETKRQIAAVYTRALMGCWVPRHKLPSLGAMLGHKSLLGMSKEKIKEHYAERRGG